LQKHVLNRKIDDQSQVQNQIFGLRTRVLVAILELSGTRISQAFKKCCLNLHLTWVTVQYFIFFWTWIFFIPTVRISRFSFFSWYFSIVFWSFCIYQTFMGTVYLMNFVYNWFLLFWWQCIHNFCYWDSVPVWIGTLSAHDGEDCRQELDSVGEERHAPIDVTAGFIFLKSNS
jgi:hypothetical protein